MQVQLDIAFDQLVEIVKTLPEKQLKRLKLEIEKKVNEKKAKIDLEKLLLKGPTAMKKQLETIENNRKAINQWRN